MLRVLFACIGNSGRSIMAEAFARHHGHGRIEARSGGSRPLGHVLPVVVEAMREKGIDVSGYASRGFDEAWIAKEADLVVTMGCGDDACPAFLGKKMVDWALPDPKGKALADVRVIRDDIERRVLALIRPPSSLAPSALSYVHRWEPVTGARETILALHGTGGDENDLVPLARQVAPHANVLSPRGKVLENGMPRFFRRHGEGVLDVEDLKRRAGELADFVADAARVYGFDPARVTALGYSNGANVAVGMLYERPASLARAVLLRAMPAYEPDARVALAGKRALLLAGERDPYSHAPASERLAASLRGRGAEVDVHYAKAGHELTQDDLATASRWLAEEIP